MRLLKGRAYFEVADNRRPFAVQARGVEARDIGTAFDIGLDARGVDVGVREGIVDVSAARVPEAIAERLEAGDWVRVTTTGRVERGRLPADQVASWTQGQLVVKNGRSAKSSMRCGRISAASSCCAGPRSPISR